MVTDNPSDKLFVQVVHFGSKASGDGTPGDGGGQGVEGGSGVDTDARRIQAEVASQIATYTG